MAQQTTGASRTFEIGNDSAQPVKSGAAIFEGSAVGLASGYARQLVALDAFVGFALDDVAAPSADGGARVKVRERGKVVLPIAGAVAADVGKLVYASDGATYTFTAASNTHVGRMVRLEAAGLAVVSFDVAIAGAYALPA